MVSFATATTVYTVTPDDHYYPNTTCHLCHNLQHYLLNVTNTKFSGLLHNGLFVARLMPNVFGNFIHFDYLVIELLNYYHSGQEGTFLIDTPVKVETTKYHNQTLIHFTNCKFQHNKLDILFYMQGMLDINLEDCTFIHSKFQIIYAELFDQNTIIIMNTSFSFIESYTWLIEITNGALQLEGPVIFTKIEQMIGTPYAAIVYLHNAYSVISFHDYIEFSEIIISTVVYSHVSEYIIVQQNTLINMTNNNFGGILWNGKDLVDEIFTDFKLAAPCFYQYHAQQQNLDHRSKD